MAITIYYDKDADLNIIKSKTVAMEVKVMLMQKI